MRLALFGASPDTPNMGVSALYKSVITSLSHHIDKLELVIFDNQLGVREETLKFANGKVTKLTFFGARGGRKFYLPENLVSMHFTSKSLSFGPFINKGIELIDSCDAVLDVSGGDSFSDIYGLDRFQSVFLPKIIALNRKKPLILLPQTYGPFNNKSVYKKAEVAVTNASMAWARDDQSFRILKCLVGDKYTPDRHLSGVDLAFRLEPTNALDLLDSSLKKWIEQKNPEAPLVGFNISGLIYNNQHTAMSNYGFQADYRKSVKGFLSAILDKTSAKIVLIPHVMDHIGHYESDMAAAIDVVESVISADKSRILVSPLSLDESQVKWLISRMDWFCGTRMHSTIAALSSGVPTASICYSDKTKGVFDTCQQADHVIDPRNNSTLEVIEKLLASFSARDKARASLKEQLPRVLSIAETQIHKIADHIYSLAK